jgi:hypothetical protein
MTLRRALDLSTTTPKPHAIEDHLCDQLKRFKGIGDFTEDFVEQSHQEGIRDEQRLCTLKDKNHAASTVSKWEFKCKLPSVQAKIAEMNQQSK